MFHLAPVGLPPRKSKSFDPRLCTIIERNVMLAVIDISETALKQKIVYNWCHPDTKALVKSLDVFLSHGLNSVDKCYWCFVREFMPVSEQQDLRRHWNCSMARQLSVAWLKDSLNRNTLHFQLLSFAKCDLKLRAKWYDKGACIRDRNIMKRICDSVEQLNVVEFQIEKPYVFRTEDVPIALATTPVSPNVVSEPVVSSPMNVNSVELQPYNSFISASYSAGFGGSSFSQLAASSYMGVTIQDLPAVNLPSSAHEPFLSTAKDRDYILDEMVRNHRKKMNGYLQTDDEPMDLDQHNLTDCSKNKSNDSNFQVPEIRRDAEDLFGETEITVDSSCVDTAAPQAHVTQSESSFKSSEVMDEQLVSGSGHSLSDIEEDQIVYGEASPNSGEIVQLAMDVFRMNVERFQRMFLVYTGHSTGQSTQKNLLLTDQFVYFLSTGVPTTEIEEIKPSSFIEATELPRINDSFFDHKVKYTTHVVLSLPEIDFVTMGIDNQFLCFHLKKRRVLVSNLEHQNKTYGFETGSKLLGKVVAQALGQAISSVKTEESNKRPVILKNSTQPLILKKFARQELNITDVEIFHYSLIYWQQNIQEQQKKQDSDELEGYLYVRSVNTKSWMRKYSEWQHKYFILKGFMLYQFSDSSCKFAEKSYNIRETIEQVFEADLKNEEKYVFELALMADDLNKSLQFSCTSQEEMSKWINNISLALSVSDGLAIPVACCLLVTPTSILFTQEGANYLCDGFIRPLGTLFLEETKEVYSVATEQHNALVVKRADGAADWIFLRDEGELKRLVTSLSEHWKVQVADCNTDEKPECNQIFLQCIKVPDLWGGKQ